MPRRREVPKREIIPDPKYNNPLIAKFINGIMRRGKKSSAEAIMYGALDQIAAKTNEDPIKIFEQALEKVKPLVEVKSRRVGGSTYQIPVEVRNERRMALSIRWLIGFAKARGEKGMVAKLAAELMDAAQGRGGAAKKREDTHRMAEANKAFAHYRW
ncbi:MAG: 30S ribosomal protein S7 [Deltaproteobacteria bacterium]|nr:30S ribosomal protein S7 [Deltaproteobacteria bacterium]MBW2052021.1 30S ribosomal protein S7 [Deltaproteobacteria bacterium]MBW2140470.1 30S ribosomal protein S7 [Deltaproteobacteria bacterium]MBW2323371.1 30S ribosomal protein S7 [Deltaproteobacteria bacterium]